VRPQLLVLEGFLAYRERTEIDFADSDLFVLSGPTGAGKSSVIDGMAFALFGTIPRLDDRRTVAPVISALADQAKVSFQFSIEEKSYTAVRLVQRTKTGATTPEARLQQGEEVLASGADEVSAAVTDLLGLSYDHFTKAVVLPQGAFADFLTDRPSDRQALLRALLDLELFEKIKVLANERAAASRAKIETFEESLAKLDMPTDDQLEAARVVLADLTRAAVEMSSLLDRLTGLERTASETAQGMRGLESKLATLRGLAIPEAIDELAVDKAAVAGGIEELESRLVEVKTDLAEVEKELQGHHDLARLDAWLESWIRLGQRRDQRDALDLPGRQAVVESTIALRDRARSDMERYRTEHVAHMLRSELKEGGLCPVCLRQVDLAPAVGEEDIDLGSLMSDVEARDEEAEQARDRLKAAEGEMRQIQERIAEAETRLTDAPARAELEAEAALVKGLVARRDEIAGSKSGLEEKLEGLIARLSELDGKSRDLAEMLMRARDSVAAEQPPLPGDDSVQSWLEFASWRDQLVDLRQAELEPARARAKEADEAVAETLEAIDDTLDRLGVERSGSPDIDLALAVERKTAELAEMERSLREAEELDELLKAEQRHAQVATALGTHLRANNFDAWLMEEALDILIEGANRLLAELSKGTYSLRASHSQFEVIDHRNADQIRSARSLSGGETFLVALALALSMADQLAQLTGTSSRLESVFLDEGFGALDQESLELVAAVLDELADQGRMVGLVTHVRELADRIPVRFEVTKGPDSAHVEKVLV
jgi:DNA repair protein SbcC/Rad50